MKRQDRRFEVVLEEAVLRYQVGDAGVMAGQLGHLLSVTSMPRVSSVGVIPFTVRERPMWTVEGFLLDLEHCPGDVVACTSAITNGSGFSVAEP